MKGTSFMNQILIILIIAIILIIHFKSKPIKENFIVLVDDENPTKANCPEYLIYDGSYYYLLDSRKAMNPENPKKFTSMREVELYLEKEKPGCKRPPLKSTIVKKINEDPTDTYQKKCNRKIAAHDYRINSCIDYNNKDLDKIRGYEKIRTDKNQATNYFLEECQVDRVHKENPHLISDSKQEVDGLDFTYQFVSNQLY
tara:strand:+ start:41 stop:637 length:597 start_codon:yes stop_codon:yes gene_type:complete